MRMQPQPELLQLKHAAGVEFIDNAGVNMNGEQAAVQFISRLNRPVGQIILRMQSKHVRLNADKHILADQDDFRWMLRMLCSNW